MGGGSLTGSSARFRAAAAAFFARLRPGAKAFRCAFIAIGLSSSFGALSFFDFRPVQAAHEHFVFFFMYFAPSDDRLKKRSTSWQLGRGERGLSPVARAVAASCSHARTRAAGRAKVTTTLGVYAQLYGDDHSEAMAALAAMAAPTGRASNVIRLRR
jgi:hypothetical protein